MQEKRKLKLKKFYFHPITVFLLATIFILIISAILAHFQIQTTYNIVNTTTKELEQKLISVENLLTYNNIKVILRNTINSFASFAPLTMLLLSLIGISIANATGLIDNISQKKLKKLSKFQLTFIFVFLGVVSSLVSDIGYVLLIPLAALIYEKNGRNPILGIITAFASTAFASSISIFTGWTDVGLIPYTRVAAHLIDNQAHISLTANLIFIILASIIISIVGTIIIEKIINKKIGKYHIKDINGHTLKTSELIITDIEEAEQNKIATEKREKRGSRYALITSIILISIFIYSIIPNLPLSGLLLDKSETSYVNMLFGSSSYLHSAFTFLIALFLALVGISYGIGAKSFKNDKELIEKASDYFKNTGMLIILIFVFSQFLSIWRMSNIGKVIASSLANLLSHLEFTDIPLIIITLIIIAIAGLFSTSITTKWQIFSPIVVPMFMQSNLSPQFAQIIMRAADSMTKGVTPLLGSFVIYLGYLNIYNQNKQKPITIHSAIKMLTSYFILISITWILLLIIWYIVGIPIGPKVYPTI